MISDQCIIGCAVTTPIACYGGTMRIKYFTLLSGIDGIDDDRWSWDITAVVRRDGNFQNAGYIFAKQNRAQRRAYTQAHYLRNKEKRTQQVKEWRADNKERKAATDAKWYLANRDRLLEYDKIWKAAHPENVARLNKKNQAKRKGMGFKPLNEPFEGSHAHHVNNDQVIYIPGDIHRGVHHNLRTGQGMAEMNALAFQYLFEHT